MVDSNMHHCCVASFCLALDPSPVRLSRRCERTRGVQARTHAAYSAGPLPNANSQPNGSSKRSMAGSATKHWSEMSNPIPGNAQYSPKNEDIKHRMSGGPDCIDEAILHELEGDSRLTADAIAVGIGVSPGECAARIAELRVPAIYGATHLCGAIPIQHSVLSRL